MPRGTDRARSLCGFASCGADKSRCGGVGELRDGLSYEARDLHLGDADLLADFFLGQIVGEAQVDDPALTLGQDHGQLLERGAVLGSLVTGVLGTEGVTERGVVVVLPL